MEELCDSLLSCSFFSNLLHCNPKSFGVDINDDEFAYRQESGVHGSDDQIVAFFISTHFVGMLVGR